MDKSFVRKDFYIAPPGKNATQSEWKKWLNMDERKARQAMSRFIRAKKITQSIEDTPDMPTTKINGIHKQIPSLGYDEIEKDERRENKIKIREARKIKRNNRWG